MNIAIHYAFVFNTNVPPVFAYRLVPVGQTYNKSRISRVLNLNDSSVLTLLQQVTLYCIGSFNTFFIFVCPCNTSYCFSNR